MMMIHSSTWMVQELAPKIADLAPESVLLPLWFAPSATSFGLRYG